MVPDDIVPAPLAPDAASLRALAGKYRTLAALRHAQGRGAPVPAAPAFRQLARTFPGALRELDTVPLPLLEGRALALEGAAETSPGGVRAWMAWQWGFHAWMRVALAAKRHLVGERNPDGARLVALAARLTKDHGTEVSLPFLRGCVAPPEGRLTQLVLDHLATRFEVPVVTVRAAVAPRRSR